MKLQIKVNITIDDSFEKKAFDPSKGMFSPDFRNKFLSYLGFLMDVQKEEKAEVDSFIIKRLPDDAPPDPDIKNDVTGDAV